MSLDPIFDRHSCSPFCGEATLHKAWATPPPGPQSGFASSLGCRASAPRVYSRQQICPRMPTGSRSARSGAGTGAPSRADLLDLIRHLVGRERGHQRLTNRCWSKRPLRVSMSWGEGRPALRQTPRMVLRIRLSTGLSVGMRSVVARIRAKAAASAA